MKPQLGLHELLHVFSFLEARDLLCAAQVDKVWNEASRTKELWRQLCLRRWSSCRISQMIPSTQTWKQYYLCRSELELRMESGRPEKDFICKAIAGHQGEIEELAYISTNEYRFDGREKSVVCTVSSDCTVRAWDLHEVSSERETRVQAVDLRLQAGLDVGALGLEDDLQAGAFHRCQNKKGTEIWSSPLQPAPLVNLVAYPQQQLVVTVDDRGLIKVWKAEDGQEWASFSLPRYSSTLEACDRPDGPFLLAACSEGDLYTLSVPRLHLLSRVNVFSHYHLNLLCSPDKEWVFATTQNSDLAPKVFPVHSLTHPPEEEPPPCASLPIWLTSRACWAPAEAARLLVLHRNETGTQLVLTTYDAGAKNTGAGVNVQVQQIASFPLPGTMAPPHLMKGHGSQVVLLVSGSELVLFTIHGLQLAAFKDHQRPITSMWVGSSQVITSSVDLSLRVYVWNKGHKFPVLKSCYHLLGGSHRWASGFTHVASDGMSIAGVEARGTGTSILRSYCFKVPRSCTS